MPLVKWVNHLTFFFVWAFELDSGKSVDITQVIKSNTDFIWFKTLK